MARDDFQGQSGGGGITDFEFTVTDAWFGESPKLSEAAGERIILLHWVGTTNLDSHPVLMEEGFHPSYRLKDGWEPSDDGKTVKFEGSGKPVFGKSYGRLCDQVFEITEEVANDPDLDPLYGDNHPSDASIWIGTRWFMAEKEYDFGSFGKKSELMPIRYLGKVDASAPAAAAPAAPSATTAAPAAANGNLRETVENLARSMDSYSDFQKAALALPGVAQDSALVMEIANQAALYDRVRS